MVRITKVTTKTGDKGQTRLSTGEQVSKASPRIAAIGDLDELNAALGLVAAFLSQQTTSNELLKKILRIQNELFDLGAQLTSRPRADQKAKKHIDQFHIERLEGELESMNKDLPSLKSFVLPGGTETSARLHLARTICRKVERTIVGLSEAEQIDDHVIPYLNRLSDWLFVAARYLMHAAGQPELLWNVPQN